MAIGYSYSTKGKTGKTATIFSRKFTADAGCLFLKAPSVDFSNTSNPKDYSYTVEDTGSLKNGDLTARKFTIKYKYSKIEPENDKIIFNAEATETFVASTGKIYSYTVTSADSDLESFDLSDINFRGDVRGLEIVGDPGATLTVAVSGGILSSGTVTIPTSGKYTTELIFPAATGTATYNLTLTQIAADSFPESITSGATAVAFVARGEIEATIMLTETGSDFTLGSDKSMTFIGAAGEEYKSGTRTSSTFDPVTSSSDMSIDAADGWTYEDFSDAGAGELVVEGSRITMPYGTVFTITNMKITFNNSLSPNQAYINMDVSVEFGTQDETLNLSVNNIIDV